MLSHMKVGMRVVSEESIHSILQEVADAIAE
jgi:succinate dehydrogenase hydrophobic anchor subunit